MNDDRSERTSIRALLSTDDLLRRGFTLAHQRLSCLFLDLSWKLIWLLLTLAALLITAIWLGSQLNSIQWLGTQNGAINSAVWLALLRQFWTAYSAEIYRSIGIIVVFSVSTWFVLEALFRPRILLAGTKRLFGTFLVSNTLKTIFLAAATLAFAAICFGRYFVTPISEWPQMWTDLRGPAVVALVTVAGLGFLLTVLDTLIRSDALALLATDLFRVTALIGILILFEAMLTGACVVLIGTGFLNVAGFNSAVAMVAATAMAVGLLNILHSYLLLVRYAAVDIMRQNVIEI